VGLAARADTADDAGVAGALQPASANVADATASNTQLGQARGRDTILNLPRPTLGHEHETTMK
jgi:hypothetical protein